MSREGPRNPPMWADATFALFVLVDVPRDELNRILQEAYDGGTVNEYMFWLADDFSNAPRRRAEGDVTYVENGTEPPIPEGWESRFRGKTIQDVADFLKQAPDELCVDWHHFAVLGEDFSKRHVITLCRIGDEELKGEELSTLPCTVEKSTLCLSSMEPHTWEEYQADQDGDNPVM